jgi:predicted RNA-binding Zn-ribbon protein involved in translation (DUF1610 family)
MPWDIVSTNQLCPKCGTTNLQSVHDISLDIHYFECTYCGFRDTPRKTVRD